MMKCSRRDRGPGGNVVILLGRPPAVPVGLPDESSEDCKRCVEVRRVPSPSASDCSVREDGEGME